METGTAAAQSTQYLTFRVGPADCALGLLRVQEIVPCEQITTVLAAPAFIKGVVSVRDRAVPVVDLAAKLGSAETLPTKVACILVTEALLPGRAVPMGLLVDSVSDVMELVSDDVQAPPDFGPGVRLDYLLGLAKRGSGFVLIIDIDRILSSEDVFAIASLEAFLQAMESGAPEGRPVEDPAPTSVTDPAPPPRARGKKGRRDRTR